MLIPNISNSTHQVAPHAARISSDAPRVVADAAVADASVATPARHPTPSPGQLQSAVDGINHAMKQSHQNLQFSVDSTTKTPVVRMTDSETGQVISQFPSEAALAIAHAIDQIQPGLLLKQQA